jgi:hypothetical protein
VGCCQILTSWAFGKFYRMRKAGDESKSQKGTNDGGVLVQVKFG